MNGKALETPVRRITTPELHEHLPEIMEAARKAGADTMRMPTPLSGKETHGDIDILTVWSPGAEGDDGQKKYGIPGSPEWRSVPSCTHFAWPLKTGGHVQVDLIKAEEETLAHSVLYYSHGTLSNHIGLLCRSAGLRFKDTGLTLSTYDDKFIRTGDFMIENDPWKTLEILGLEKNIIHRILTGSFKDKEESYEILPLLNIYNPAAIHIDRMTAQNRSREKKRPETTNLMEWVQARPDSKKYKILPPHEEREELSRYRKEIQREILGDRFDEITKAAKADHIQREETRRLTLKTKDTWFEDVTTILGTDRKATGAKLNLLAQDKGLKVTELRDMPAKEVARLAREY